MEIFGHERVSSGLQTRMHRNPEKTSQKWNIVYDKLIGSDKCVCIGYCFGSSNLNVLKGEK